ncbi:MAG: MotA/TolQ/ExbB proton channel family protein [Planctomycetota bacterium]
MMELTDYIATAAASAPNADSAVAVQSVWDFLVKGGVMMIPIGLCSLIVMTVTIERLMVLRKSAVMPKGLENAVNKALNQETGAKTAALKACKNSNSPLGRILTAGVSVAGRPIEAVERRLANAGEHELFDLRKRMRVLSVIAAAAPLLGLVGTIFGMIKAFQTVAESGEALGKTELLAEGIYEAMITTAAGLLVAIPAMMLYHWLSGKIERLTRELDRICVAMAEQLAGPGSNPGRLSLTSDESSDTPARPAADAIG